MRNQQRHWHEAGCHTRPPMKLFLGHIVHLQGVIDSYDSVVPEARILITLLQRVATNPRFHASWLKGMFSQVTPLHSQSFPCDFTVTDRWPDFQKAAATINLERKHPGRVTVAEGLIIVLALCGIARVRLVFSVLKRKVGTT